MARAIASGLRVLATLAAASLLLGAAGESGAPQKQRYVFKTPPGAGKYVQQHAIDVGDVPGHQVRLLELHYSYTEEAPVYDGVKVKESWLRAASDYTEGNGRAAGYTVAVLENGDKIFGRWEAVTQMTVRKEGEKLAQTNSITTLTGGTGKFTGIHGTLHGVATTDFKALSEATAEGEYWIEK